MSVEKARTGAGYTVRWRDSTGRQRSKRVTLYRDAVQLDGEMKRKRAMGELVTHERGAVRLCDFWPLWVERYGAIHVTRRTMESYDWLWRKHLNPALGRYRLRDLTAEDIDAMTARLSRTLSAGSVRKCVAVLQGVLQKAVDWQYISTNVARGAEKPRVVAREGQALTDEQLAALVNELPTLRSKVIVRVLAGTGLRPGELRALRWRDVLDYSGIAVTRAVSRNQIGPTKTYGRRTVLMNGDAIRALQEWQLATGTRAALDRELVFPAVDGKGLWTDVGWRQWQRKVFTPAADRAGLKGLVPYDLRHTFVSRLIAAGGDIYWVARQAGHSPTVALTTYAHQFERRADAEPTEPDQAVDRRHQQ